MTIADIKKSAAEKMQKSIEAFKNDLGKIRTGRVHTGLLDHVQVATGRPWGAAHLWRHLIDLRKRGKLPRLGRK